VKKLRVLLDSQQRPFSERYKAILIAHGVEVEDFSPHINGIKGIKEYVRFLGNSKSRIVHFLWAHYHWSIPLIPRLLGKKVILHWVGSDVSIALREPQIPWKLLGSTHLVMDAQQSQELSKLHIKSTVIRAPCNFSDSITPWLAESTVLTYLPRNDNNLYGEIEVLELARQLPQVNFLVVGRSDNFQISNVKCLGWVDDQAMNEAYARCKVVLRLTNHDAGAAIAMEGLYRNRYVVWTKPYPFCEQVDLSNLLHIKQTLLNCLNNTEPNYGAREAVLADFDQEKIAQQLIKIYKGEKV
jgi:glycosyltransferase involved in cell wall biosynthesis